MHYSELDILATIQNFVVRQYGRGCFIDSKPAREDYAAALAGLKEMGTLLETGEYDVVVLDEANIALYFGLIRFEDLKKILLNRAGHVEVILTGRYAPQELINLADLVTEMKEIKHYYTKGVEARTGVEK